jgi:phage/plasmid-like protein (TIGR03299 family)
MSDGLDMSNDRANMAYVGAVPWHGMGAVLDGSESIEQWAEAAGLGHKVSMRPSFFQDDDGLYKPAPNNFHVVRDDTQESLSVMTGRYKPVQPIEALEFFRDFIETDERFKLETAGSLNGGKRIWALARFQDTVLAGGDEHAAFIMLATSYNGTLATLAQPTLTRVVCQNTIGVALSEGRTKRSQVKVPHSVEWTERVRRDAQDRLSVIVAGFDEYKALGDALASFKLSREQTEDFLKGLIFDDRPDRTDIKRDKLKGQYDKLFESWITTAGETEGDTAWAALQAVTRFVDHSRNTRATGGESKESAKMASAFFGSGAALKSEAVAKLAQIAGIDRTAIMVAAHEADPVLVPAE